LFVAGPQNDPTSCFSTSSGEVSTPRSSKNDENVDLFLNKRVKANWEGKGDWHPGYISAVNEDGTVSVTYDDGDFEASVERKRFKFTGAKQRIFLDAIEATDPVDDTNEASEPPPKSSKSSKSAKATKPKKKAGSLFKAPKKPAFIKGLYPTVAVSDLFNVLGHAAAAYLVSSVAPFASYGFATVAVAAAVGVLRFGFSEDMFAATNGDLADYAAFVGLPMVGYEFAGLDSMISGWLFCGLLTMFEVFTRPFGEKIRNGVFKPLVNVLFFVLPCALSNNVSAQVGIAVFVIGAVLIGPEREKFLAGVRRENWFHYFIALAAVLCGKGLAELNN